MTTNLLKGEPSRRRTDRRNSGWRTLSFRGIEMFCDGAGLIRLGGSATAPAKSPQSIAASRATAQWLLRISRPFRSQRY